jgi:hypothetical protein
MFVPPFFVDMNSCITGAIKSDPREYMELRIPHREWRIDYVKKPDAWGNGMPARFAPTRSSDEPRPQYHRSHNNLREGLIAMLRIVRLRAALADAMEWRWSGEPPPADVVSRCEAALGITDEIPAAYAERVVTPDSAESVPA